MFYGLKLLKTWVELNLVSSHIKRMHDLIVFLAKKVREQFSYMRRRFEEEHHARKNGYPRPKLPDPDSANYRKPLFVYDQLTFLEPYINTDKEASCDGELNDTENCPGTSTFDEIQANYSDNSIVMDYVTHWAAAASAQCVTANDGNIVDQIAAELLPQFKEIKEEFKSGSIEKRKRKQPPPKRASKAPTLTPPSTNSESPPSQDLKNSLTFPNFNADQPMDNEMLLQIAKAFSDNCNPAPSNTVAIEDEECNLFGRQVSMDLKRLNLQNRAIARYRINKILMELTVKECPGGETQSLNFD